MDVCFFESCLLLDRVPGVGLISFTEVSYGCLSVATVVCCQVEVYATG